MPIGLAQQRVRAKFVGYSTRCTIGRAAGKKEMVGSRQGLLLTLLVRASLVAGLARRADKAALIDLYRLLDGPNWFNNDGWDPDGGADPCSFESRWRGVGCIDPCDIYRDGPTCAFGRITALNLRDNNLTGSITNWTGIGDLHNLSWVDLSVNAISGSLPAEIGQVQNVEVLNMAWNQLEGGLPTTIGALNSNGYAQVASCRHPRCRRPRCRRPPCRRWPAADVRAVSVRSRAHRSMSSHSSSIAWRGRCRLSSGC